MDFQKKNTKNSKQGNRSVLRFSDNEDFKEERDTSTNTQYPSKDFSSTKQADQTTTSNVPPSHNHPPPTVKNEYENLQYLPMNGNFFISPGSGLPYMDPFGIMNPAAFPPFTYTTEKKKSVRKQRQRCC